jgi:hypothetical protein
VADGATGYLTACGAIGVSTQPHTMTPPATDIRTACHVAAVFASLVGLAAAVLATVSLSIGFG